MNQSMGDDTSNTLDEIVDQFGSDISASEENSDREGSDDEGGEEELSKEEIAEEFDVQFAKKPGNSVQHLVEPEKTTTYCGLGLGKDTPIIDEPGPFDPICTSCRQSVGGRSMTGGQTYADLREWLANEIPEVSQPDIDSKSTEQLRKQEVAGIVSYIKSLKEEE